MTHILLPALLLVASGLSHAGTEAEERLEALGVLIEHSETVACDTTFIGHKSARELLRNVHAMERDEEIGSATYYILWGGDMGCNRGAGTSSWFVSEVGRHSDSRPFMVRTNHVFGEQFASEVNPRFIRELKKTGDRQFVVISSEHAESDANNFPSKRYRYTLEMRQGVWQVVDRKFLGRNEY
ncbi:hypothetical protein [Thauera sp. Sel9]|uniref:hypothetical protein n=1 Tax=Thauera sp. Sel9 TaxID=2974299 RepID=UPI0021E186AD|nr:hypothetical protein [Thauera sp. Sel9]MCV2218176.1 hypothetical protein [Thauera sp. Sel9]